MNKYGRTTTIFAGGPSYQFDGEYGLAAWSQVTAHQDVDSYVLDVTPGEEATYKEVIIPYHAIVFASSRQTKEEETAPADNFCG